MEQPTWDTFRFDFWPDGSLRLHGRDGWREAICSVCHEPIKWVLDMMSFRPDPPGYSLAHARCVWLPEAFDGPPHRPSSPGPASLPVTEKG